MGKTIHGPGRPVSSSMLNAINDHVHDGKDQDGSCDKIDLALHIDMAGGKLPLSMVEVSGGSMPIGGMMVYPAATPPSGWMICDGSAVPLTPQFAALKAVVGNNVPDLRGRAVIGAGTGVGLTARNLGAIGGEESHKLSIEEMPDHAHAVKMRKFAEDGVAPGATSALDGSLSNDGDTLGVKSTTTGVSHNNMMPFLSLNWIIRAF